uniref:Butyrophilin subfamily 1 member A1-like n=1 Tax=Terrapene triunguis TaxID=2587831 RepID=A0A674JFZ8_9SAUR
PTPGSSLANLLDMTFISNPHFPLSLFYFCPGAAQFTVIGPSDPVIAIVGQETVLSCHLSPRMSAVNMEVRWFRSEFSSFVHWYHDGKDQYEMQMPEYRGRTELLKAGLTDGNVALRIFNIRHSDEGLYHCFVQDDTFDEVAVLELQVAEFLCMGSKRVYYCVWAQQPVNVTLDPDTAHPQLILSEDRKSVRWRDTWQDLPDNPKRFDTEFCVLGCEGFTSGRHCWEVEVGDGQYWAVGVARESVRRKGWINQSPEGGIWAVWRWQSQFQTLTSPDIRLPLNRVLSRIRVCLDCDQGQVTFFDVGNEAPIFTFLPASVTEERIRYPTEDPEIGLSSLILPSLYDSEGLLLLPCHLHDPVGSVVSLDCQTIESSEWLLYLNQSHYPKDCAACLSLSSTVGGIRTTW